MTVYMTCIEMHPQLGAPDKFLHMPDGQRVSFFSTGFPSMFSKNEVCLETEGREARSWPCQANPRTFSAGVAQRQEIAKRWAWGHVWLAPFPFSKSWNEDTAYCPHCCGSESRKPSQMAQGWRDVSPRRRRTKLAALEPKKCAPIAKLLCGVWRIFFLYKFCFKQCQPLTFSLYAHSTFKPASISLVYKTLNVTHTAHAPH